ncbi:MAG: hypothetical protein KDA80_05520 [Planctomycetaceae bacterium]|nr:hypothetical protein [Planctomycetaceae bacterium]
MAVMIRMNSQAVPYSELTYIGFRLAYSDTLERLELARQLDLSQEHCHGYLAEVPFLRQVPVQVQLELLMETWARHLDSQEWQATLLDESVLYAAFETAARMIRLEPTIASRFLARGPIPCGMKLNSGYADALQKMHLKLIGNCSFLVISQYQDLPPSEIQAWKQSEGIPPAADECLFDALGRWYVSRDFLQHSTGLLAEQEAEHLASFFQSTGCCVR